MGAKRSPLPALRADRFELGGRAEILLDLLLPLRINRDPIQDERDPNLWALEGILGPDFLDGEGRPKRVLLASNIPDVKITKNDVEREISGGDIVSMLATARLSRLSLEYPNIGVLDGGEATTLSPEETSPPQYTERVKVNEGISVAFAQGAYSEHIGVVSSAVSTGFKAPDLGRTAWFGAEAIGMPAAA